MPPREFQVVQEGEGLRLRLALRDGSNEAEERLGEVCALAWPSSASSGRT